MKITLNVYSSLDEDKMIFVSLGEHVKIHRQLEIEDPPPQLPLQNEEKILTAQQSVTTDSVAFTGKIGIQMRISWKGIAKCTQMSNDDDYMGSEKPESLRAIKSHQLQLYMALWSYFLKH